MKKQIILSGLLSSLFVVAIFVTAVPASADGPSTPQQMPGMMHDMSTEMGRMSEEMSKGDMTMGMQKRMGTRMKEMSGMMGKMSGMMGKGMTDTDMQKQMEQMRKRIDDMMKEPSVAPKKK